VRSPAEGLFTEPPALSLIAQGKRWFWTPEWQAKEREADEDIAQGRVKDFDSIEALLKPPAQPKTRNRRTLNQNPGRVRGVLGFRLNVN